MTTTKAYEGVVPKGKMLKADNRTLVDEPMDVWLAENAMRLTVERGAPDRLISFSGGLVGHGAGLRAGDAYHWEGRGMVVPVKDIPQYASDPRAACEMMDALRERGWRFNWGARGGRKGYSVEAHAPVWDEGEVARHVAADATGSTFPEALALAVHAAFVKRGKVPA